MNSKSSSPGEEEPVLEPTLTNVQVSPILPQGAHLAGRFRIRERIGAGGMGIVYRAYDEHLEIDVAVKVLRSGIGEQVETAERFRREVLLARQVSHPNVVRIHDLIIDGGNLLLTMDLIVGRSLKERLKETGRLDVEEALAITRQVAGGLEAAHRRGVVHRDLKPGNILLDAEGQAYVTDFGIARSTVDTALTQPGQLIGTPDYLSPEQALGQTVDHRSDIYTLGLLLFEMVSGELPFSSAPLPEMLAQRASGVCRDLGTTGVEAPPFVRQILHRCLARDPDQRYQDMGELKRDLDARGVVSPVVARPRTPWQAVVGGLLTLVALVAGLIAVRPARPPAAVSGTAATIPVARSSIAVLPLQDQTGDPELAWLSAGFAEGLSASLAESDELRVIDSLRVLRLVSDLKLPLGRLSPGELDLLGEMLDVEQIVVGWVRRGGGQIRIELRLITLALPGFPSELFSAEIDRNGELFLLLRELGAELRLHLTNRPRKSLPQVLSDDPIALAAYGEGLTLQSQGASASALPFLVSAVERDPDFLAAWVRLAKAYERQGYEERALEAVRKAVDLLPARPASRLSYLALARKALLEGEPETAQDFFQQLLRAYPHDIEGRIELAEAYGAQGRFGEAKAVLEAVVELEPHHPQAWYLLGRYSIQDGDFQRASDDYLVRALVIQKRLGHRQGQADVLNALGVAYQKQGDFTQAIEHYRQAGELLRELDDHRGYSAVLANLAGIYRYKGEFAAAREAFEEALALRRELGDKAGIAEFYNRLGALDEHQGLLRQALENYRQALTLRRELGDQRALAESYNNVGFMFHLLGEIDNAAVYFERALGLYRQDGNREGVVAVSQSIAQLDLNRGDWQSGADHLLEALELSRELGTKNAEALSLAQLGRLAQYRGRYRSALDGYEEALELFGELDDRRGQVEITLYEIGALLELGMLEEAGARLRKVREWLAEAENREQYAELRRLEGWAALLEGDLQKARLAFEESASLALESGVRSVELWARLGLGRTNRASGQTAAARKILNEVAAVATSLGNMPLEFESSMALGELALAEGDLAAAEEAVRSALRLAQEHQPFATAYRSHVLLARISSLQQQREEALRQHQRAAELIAQISQDLDGDERQAFNLLSEVQYIEQGEGSITIER